MNKNNATINIGGVHLNNKNKYVKIIFFGVSMLVITIIIWMIVDKQSTTTSSTSIDYSNQPFLGEEDASVQIVEFGDYKCPACKSFTEGFVPLIEKDFIDTGKANFYFMNYDFIYEDSTRTAEFAETVYQELGNETFWKFHELVYDNQPVDEKVDFFTEDKLVELLSEVTDEDSVEKVRIAFENGGGEDALATDNEYVKQLNIQSTPSVFINGELFTGGTYEDFSRQVNEVLEGE